MKKIFKAIRLIRKDLLLLLFLSISTYLLIELYLINKPSLFDGAYQIGQFFSKISISYISGFIFYFIVVHVKSISDKEHVNEYVGHEVYSIITSGHLLIQPLMQKENPKAKFRYLNRTELTELLATIDPVACEAPMLRNDENVSWIEWIEYLSNSTQKHINNIFQRFTYLDPILIKLLTRVENSIFLRQLNLLHSYGKGHKLDFYHPQFEMHMSLLEELEKYADKHFKEYQYRTSEFMGYKR